MTLQNPDRNLPEFSGDELERINAWISQRLDASPSEWRDADLAEIESASPVVKQRLAGLQWVHGLLLESQRGQCESQAARIQRAMQALPEHPGESPEERLPIPQIAVVAKSSSSVRSSSLSSKWTRWVIAVAVLLCVGVLWQVGGGVTPAQAAVEQALQVAAEHRDRQFRVIAELQPAEGALQQIESQLFVRGPNEFVLNHPGLLPGARLWIGTDGQIIWAVPQIGPVLVSRENGPLKDWLNQFQVSTPYLQLTTVLTNLRDRYTVQELPAENLASTTQEATGQRFRRIHGTSRVGSMQTGSSIAKLLPGDIDLWVHPITGEVRRLVLNWPALPSGVPRTVQRVTFDLVNIDPQPVDWYQHQPHHRPERRIVRPGGQK
ncbi:MAG: hypothetical protein JWN70_4626 [Planctomycetaceae bacterium]|nr:hypothetical protein [Planctomycetaceae bacterium]